MRSQNVSSICGFGDAVLICQLVPEHLLKLFPIGRVEAGTANEEREPSDNESFRHLPTDEHLVDVIRKVHGSLKHQRPFSENEISQSNEGQKTGISRPGSQYKAYQREEDLPPAAHALYGAATKAIGVSMKTLVAAVLQTEWNLQMWAEADRKMAHTRAATAGAETSGVNSANLSRGRAPSV